jgi:hypothetical protein
MLYEKPQLFCLNRAFDAIMHKDKGNVASDSNGSSQLATANAYEADE